jgi:hypothetical protein
VPKQLIYFLVVGIATIAGVMLVVNGVGAPTETEVYAAYLNRTIEGHEGEKDISLIVNSSTGSVREQITSLGANQTLEQKLTAHALKANPGAVEALTKIGEQKSTIDVDLIRLVRPELRIRIVKEDELRRTFSNASLPDAWKQLRGNSVASLVTFSRVGFDGDRKHALMFVSMTCGPLCGAGQIVVLERRWGAWHVIETKRVWVS